MTKERNKGGYPGADKVANRCQGQNREGNQCGWGAIPGLSVCRHHVAKADPDSLPAKTTGDRLRELSLKALERLEQVIATGDDRDAVRASAIILDRTLPKPASHQALIINHGGNVEDVTGEPQPSAADQIRARLSELRSRQPALQEIALQADSALPPLPAQEQPEPAPAAPVPILVAVQQIPHGLLADQGGDIVEAEPDPVPLPYGVTRVTHAPARQVPGRAAYGR